jgi:hypothetical protein
MGFSNINLHIHSDNQATIGSLSKGRIRNFHINLSIRHIYVVLASQFITPELVYIAFKNNPVDPISCRELGSLKTRITFSFILPGKLQHVFFCLIVGDNYSRWQNLPLRVSERELTILIQSILLYPASQAPKQSQFIRPNLFFLIILFLYLEILSQKKYIACTYLIIPSFCK